MKVLARTCLLSFFLALLLVPMEQGHAISFGCKNVQASVTKLNTSFVINKNNELKLIRNYRYQSAYKAYWNAQKSYKVLYDSVHKSKKCFSASFRQTIGNFYSSYYKQVGACDRYGYQICSAWIKAPSMPCDDAYSTQDFLDCMEDQARPDPEYAD
jgi:hypothetical protein